jgi:hypothetical protein
MPDGVPATLQALARTAFPAAPLPVASARWLGLLASLAALWGSCFGFDRSLARDQPVTMSSVCLARPRNSPFPAEPARLVDGSKWREYDACTSTEHQPWIAVDLGAPRHIEEVVVTGRRDCCWGYRDLPLVLELSDSTGAFHEVARRESPFSDREPWRIRLPGVRGRQLLLRVASEHAAKIVLTEIEVFGSRD